MEIMKILLIGSDMNYCKALSESVSQLFNSVLMTVCSQENGFSQDKVNFQLIIIEGKQENEIYRRTHNAIFLVENRSEACMEFQKNIFCIYKYANVKDMMKEIFIIFNLISGRSVTISGNSDCKIISIYSCYGGVGKTSISMGLAQEFVRFRGKKTLYINFNEWDGPNDFYGKESGNELNSVGSYLYYLNVKSEVNLSSFLNEDDYGVCFFYPTSGRNQLKGLNIEELHKFINHLTEEKRFDYIFFDCHNCLDETSLWLLDNSSYIIYIFDSDFGPMDDLTCTRDKNVIEYIGKKLNSRIEEKIIRVSNMNTEYDIRFEGDNVIYIEQDVESFQNNKKVAKINIDRGFGQGIKIIADRIENG